MWQKAISKWGSFDNLLFQNEARVISKWVGDSNFKVGKSLFQSGAVTSKWGKMLFQSVAVISKWGITIVSMYF